MRSTEEIIMAVADAKGVSAEELAMARDNGAIYSDGECWMLTNAGRARLRQIRVDRELTTAPFADIMKEYVTGCAAITFVPPTTLTDTANATPVSAKETQIGGDHYKKLGKYQPWEVLAHWLTPEELRGYAKGTAITYFAREQDKGGDQDIAKGIHTLQLWQEVRKDK